MKAFVLVFLLLFSGASFADVENVVGRWKTIDDETKKPKSIVEIFKRGEEFRGRIVQLINPDKPNPVCDKCEGDRKDKPVMGMEIIWGMKKDGDQWESGKILDPNNGKEYKCRLRLKDNGQKLEVRGFIGFSLLGRSQLWERMTEEVQ